MKLYHELAHWWPLLSDPAEYEEEAAIFTSTLQAIAEKTLVTLLELGSGGGNNASHMKAHFDLTLVDASTDMLAVSKALNPGCVHVQGDMRTARLGRQFDAVFIHDAIEYMTSRVDLKQAITTAFAHCKPGGVALFVPDQTKELFKPETDCGGHDGPARSMRYMEWQWDPDPDDDTYVVDYTYTLRDADHSVSVVHDRHTLGVFPRQVWLDLITSAGFEASAHPFVHSELGPGHEFFIGRRKK
ncbi:MAG: class I SAM-dependent methyltransferase [Bacteroidota bacterium]